MEDGVLGWETSVGGGGVIYIYGQGSGQYPTGQLSSNMLKLGWFRGGFGGIPLREREYLRSFDLFY